MDDETPKRYERTSFITVPPRAPRRREKPAGERGARFLDAAGTPRCVADLIRTLESDLFGAYEWAAQLYEELRDIPEAPDRLAVYRGLLRAYEALEGKADDAMRAAEGVVAAEDDLDETERAILAPLAPARDALFAAADAPAAKAFVAAFDPRWSGQAEKEALVADAMLAALAHSNVIAATRLKLPPEEAAHHHARAAQLYEDVFAILNYRANATSPIWRETAQSALFRAAVAWRFAGDEGRSKRAQEIAGAPPGFERRS